MKKKQHAETYISNNSTKTGPAQDLDRRNEIEMALTAMKVLKKRRLQPFASRRRLFNGCVK